MDFAVSMATPGLILPAPAEPATSPTDGLWQHTCCEAFLSRPGHLAYREFNFSPSGQWAAYAFADTRQPDPAAGHGWQEPPAIACSATAQGFTLSAELAASQIPAGSGALRIGLSVVLETRTVEGQSRCSYWALHHPAARPDFHHPAAFTLTIDCPSPP